MDTDVKTFSEQDNNDKVVTQAKDVAKFFGKSLTWVYEHHKKLGGVRLGGSFFFPSERRIYERLFGKKDGEVLLRLPAQKEKVPFRRLPNKKSSPGFGSSSKRRVETIVGHVRDRHGLL